VEVEGLKGRGISAKSLSGIIRRAMVWERVVPPNEAQSFKGLASKN
jgi:hypothetical protein